MVGTTSEDRVAADLMRQIAKAISSIRYGSVEIIIHDSRVVQIERKEKIRFESGGSNQAG